MQPCLIQINGLEMDAPPGSTILQACSLHGISIPTLCHDHRRTPTGACRLCLVEIENHPHLATACNTPIEPGMRIHTHSDRVEQHRRSLLELLVQHHPAADCPSPI